MLSLLARSRSQPQCVCPPHHAGVMTSSPPSPVPSEQLSPSPNPLGHPYGPPTDLHWFYRVFACRPLHRFGAFGPVILDLPRLATQAPGVVVLPLSVKRKHSLGKRQQPRVDLRCPVSRPVHHTTWSDLLGQGRELPLRDTGYRSRLNGGPRLTMAYACVPPNSIASQRVFARLASVSAFHGTPRADHRPLSEYLWPE
jgi:hypothetical protein